MILFLFLLVLLGQSNVCQCDDGQAEYRQLAIFEMPSVNEFDLAELNLYNNLISCVANFKLQFVKCNKQLQQLGKCLTDFIDLFFQLLHYCSCSFNQLETSFVYYRRTLPSGAS